MNRDYSNGQKDDVEYFVGNEVEKTPAYDKKTLFVVGIKSYRDILKLATRNDCDHVYLGANQSFDLTGEYGTEEETSSWEENSDSTSIPALGLVSPSLTTFTFHVIVFCALEIRESASSWALSKFSLSRYPLPLIGNSRDTRPLRVPLPLTKYMV